jgi:RHS repeat-associated protein
MIQVTRPAADGTTLQVGESTEHHPTLSGIVLAQVDATGGRAEYTHDALGRAIAIKTPLGGTVTNTYDALGRVTKSETRDASNTVVASTNMTYDHFDQPLVTTHADGSTEVNAYDASGRLIEKGGNAAYPLRYTYDALGRMATMTDGNNSTTAWAYNDLGQVEAKTYADDSIWRYTYTAAGQLATRTWARTQSGDQPLVTTYSYTPSGQLASVAYNDGTTPSVSFTYDQQGRRLSMTTGSTPGSAGISARDAITTDSIYDAAGRLMAIDNGTQTLGYTYNAYNQRLSMSVSGTSTSTLNLNYNYDAAGRLITIATDDQTHRYIYHPGTRQLAIRTSGNVTTTYAYDTGQGMLTSIENKAGATIVSKYAYTINNRGQRTQVSQSGAAFTAPSSYGWLYNSKGEVVAANHTTDTTKNRAYNYDPIGNRRWSTEGNPATSTQPESPDPLAAAISEYTSNNLNQYTSVSSVPSVVNPTYDLDGNMTDTGAGAQYTWDAENRLIRVTKFDGTEICYAYDGESRRIKREVYKNSTLQSSTRYLYDGWNVIAEFDAMSSDLRPLSSYTWGLDLSGSLQGAGGVGGLLSKTDYTSTSSLNLIYTFDGNGNVSELIATDNGIAAHYEYDAFGKTITKQGSHADANTYRFSTKPLDVEGGLYYYGYRFYDANFGRWPNRDPFSEHGGINLYSLLNNDVVNLYDFLGLFCDDQCSAGQKQLVSATIIYVPAGFPPDAKQRVEAYAGLVGGLDNAFTAMELLDLAKAFRKFFKFRNLMGLMGTVEELSGIVATHDYSDYSEIAQNIGDFLLSKLKNVRGIGVYTSITYKSCSTQSCCLVFSRLDWSKPVKDVKPCHKGDLLSGMIFTPSRLGDSLECLTEHMQSLGLKK